MNTYFFFLQILVSVLLIAAIIVQNRGVGFGRVWGGGGSSFARRGLEKIIFRATFVLVGLFILLSILQFII